MSDGEEREEEVLVPSMVGVVRSQLPCTEEVECKYSPMGVLSQLQQPLVHIIFF